MSDMGASEYEFAALRSRFAGTRHGALRPDTPRYHLFHAPNSICSQKVRATLFALDEPFVSYQIDMFTGENYDPLYVRARVRGCREAGLPLSSLHLGATSAEKTGCDACVVPTLVHDESHRIMVDSHRICLALDSARRAGVPSLLPQELKQAIEDELAIVDMLPNYPLLASEIAKAQNATGDGNPFARSKVARCEKLMQTYAGDPDLLAAYTAKRDKERSADARLFTQEALARSYSDMKRAFEELDGRLAKSQGQYLFGDTLTFADLFWGAELIRAEDLHLESIWTDGRLPALAGYYDRLASLPALKRAIIDWPGARFSFARH